MPTPDPQQSQRIEHSSIQGSQVQQGQAGKSLTQIQADKLTQVYVSLFRGDRHNHAEKLRLDLAQQLLKNHIQPELRQRLKNTVQNIWLNPDLEEQPDQVGELTPRRIVQIPGKPPETLDLQTTILEVFISHKRLLILGEPGIGKTTTLLTLADQLIEQALANPGTAIPVIFELSSWKEDDQSIEDWLIQQLTKNYQRVSPKIVKCWLEAELLIPFLDGLDELESTQQDICIQRLNKFAEHYPFLVVCCRSEEYEAGNLQLRELRSAVRLQPLTSIQIQGYLQQVKQQSLWEIIDAHPQRQVFLNPDNEGKPGIFQIPLFLKIAAEVYGERPFNSKTELLEAYIDRRLNPDVKKWERKKYKNQRWAYRVVEKEPDWEQTLYHLSWLAWQLKKNNQVELLVDHIQPHWIKSLRLLRLYQIIITLAVVLGNGLTGSLIFGQSMGVGAFLVGMEMGIFGLMGGNVLNSIEPVEAFKNPMSRVMRPKILRICREWLNIVLVSLLIIILSLLLSNALKDVLDKNSLIFLSQTMPKMTVGLLILYLSIGLVAVLSNALKQDLEVKSFPTQGIWNSFQTLCWVSLLSYPLGVLFASLSFTEVIFKATVPLQSLAGTQQSIQTSLTASLLPGLFAALWFGFVFGGGFVCIQHLCLRLILTCGSTLPWNYARFLNYCVERRLLQRIGGRYRFLHRELLEYFAHKAGGVS